MNQDAKQLFVRIEILRGHDALESVHKHSVKIITSKADHAPEVVCDQLNLYSCFPSGLSVGKKSISAIRKSSLSLDGRVGLSSTSFPAQSWLQLSVRQQAGSPMEEYFLGMPHEYREPSLVSYFALDVMSLELNLLRYIASHQDLALSIGADITKARAHYKQFGLRERRVVNFDPNAYVDCYSDLQHLKGKPLEACKHYIRYGVRENRVASCT